MTTSEELAQSCAQAAEDIQAENIQVLDLRGISGLTDFLVICSGNSMPHLKAIMREVEKGVIKSRKETPLYTEGRVDSLWVILDYIDVMVHIMHEDTRDLYQLEELWGNKSTLTKETLESALLESK